VLFTKQFGAFFEAFLFLLCDTACGGCKSRSSPVADLNKDQARLVSHNQIDLTELSEKVAGHQREALL
jgi:hypothetical protein